MEKKNTHPAYPESNVAKFSDYNPNNYAIDNVSRTIITNECMSPGRPPYLTQQSIGKYLIPLNKELDEVPIRPRIDELPDAVLDQMVKRDKAFWVDKPGANDYTIHDAYHNYGIVTEIVLPTHQDVFPRSYQYDLDCVRYRRFHACDDLKKKASETKVGMNLFKENTACYFSTTNMRTSNQPTAWKILLQQCNDKPLSAHCRDCQKLNIPGLTPFQLAWAKDSEQKRWRYYPDLTATLTQEEIRASMETVGRPFQNEACNWYYHNYPPVKYDCILRKFSK